MANIVVLLVILIIVTLSVTKIVIEKRRGTKCIGCPHGGSKGKNSGCNC